MALFDVPLEVVDAPSEIIPEVIGKKKVGVMLVVPGERGMRNDEAVAGTTRRQMFDPNCLMIAAALPFIHPTRFFSAEPGLRMRESIRDAVCFEDICTFVEHLKGDLAQRFFNEAPLLAGQRAALIGGDTARNECQ